MSVTAKHSAPQLDKAVQGFAKSFAGDFQFGAERGKVTFEEMLQNKFFLVHAIRRGIPYALFDLIAAQSPFTQDDWISFLDISLKTLQRYKADHRDFKPMQSEKILELAEVTQLGLEVFGDMEKFKLWLNTPSMALGKMKPIELLADSFGKELVMTELVHIEHGIFA
ncbi:MAG TPA: antitoxin Xre/MbcA/ParS toxin-binding domain-containing protein [Bacteroidia bacterium]|jgi:putative toxin-antitoxin system antitoxin component (TIGR02293 family)|nr:antitoxin Xre/MbcA/ParS toxin-binding domain-containing protein [Bacteroidia bacterium]